MTLLRKELRWQMRTWRLLAVPAVFLIAGVSAPLLLYFLPDLAATAGEEITFEIPEFGAADAVKGFMDNLGQFGLIVVILAGMGAISSERSSGTAEMTLSKPAGFGAFVTAKFASQAATLLLGLIVAGTGAYLYTALLFEAPDPGRFAAGTLLFGVYLSVVLSITLLASSVTRSQLLSGVVSLAFVIVLGVLGSLSGAREVLPAAITRWAYSYASGPGNPEWVSLGVSLAIAAGALAAAARLLRTREL
jgi:ABC-2 type transport system permease protein